MTPMSHVHGLGAAPTAADVAATCGPNACGFFDNLLPWWQSQACKDWICCANPGGPACTTVTTGVFAGATQAVGQGVTQTAADAVTSFFTGMNPLGVAALLVAGFAVFKMLGK